MSQIRLYNVVDPTIQSFAKGSLPPYLAASHVWSEELFPLSLTHARASPGVSAARESVRRHFPDISHLWVDTLCIDQKDEGDKMEQIPHMREIYEGCAAVVIVLSDRIQFYQAQVDQMEDFFEQLNRNARTAKWRKLGRRAKRPSSVEREMLVRTFTLVAKLWGSKWASRV